MLAMMGELCSRQISVSRDGYIQQNGHLYQRSSGLATFSKRFLVNAYQVFNKVTK